MKNSNDISAWVKAKVNSMRLEEKVGQLIITRPKAEGVEENIAEGRVGGLYTGSNVSPERIAQLKKLAAIPLIIAQDLESGSTSGGPSWPSAMSVSALCNKKAAYEWAYMQGLQARSYGVNANFGPVLDLGINRNNQHTGIRSIGSDPAWVAELAVEFVRGYQDAGILPFAKHFPGFGRGIEDPHMEISNLTADKTTIWNEELLPYREAIQKADLMGVMTGHVFAPAIDPEFPATVSTKTIGLLKDMGFTGLIITDSLTMKGILQYDSSENLYINAILAGHDMILANYHMPDKIGFNILLKAVQDGRIPEELINMKVEKILSMKAYLENFQPNQYNMQRNKITFEKMSEDSMTYYRADGGTFRPLMKNKRRLFLIATEENAGIQGELDEGISCTADLYNNLKSKYPESEIILIPLCPGSSTIEKVLFKSLSHDEVVMIAHTQVGCYTGTDHFHKPLISLASALKKKTGNFVVWGNPYAALDLPRDIRQIIFVYDRGPWVKALIKLLEGDIKAKGRLPVKLDWN
jgi:beta-glucosidase-like glycosyl hydrolase